MAASQKLAGFRKKDLIALHKNMVLSRFLDNKMLILLKQGKGYFHIGAAGHEAIQTAAAFSMQPGKDYAYPYYRDLVIKNTISFPNPAPQEPSFCRLSDVH